MFNFFANIFGYLLNIIYGVVNNYGIAIIIFTLILKIVMLPISVKQQKTMKKTAKIQKEAQIIQEKYSNDQVRQSQELMELYKRENMSPFSGCLSSILQIILVLSMFYLVSRPLTYMKHVDQTLISSYTQQIEEKSGEKVGYPEIAIIKEFSNSDENVNINMNFLGLDLSDIPTQNLNDWKVYVIPVLYVLTSLLSTKLTMNANKKKQEKDENIVKVVEKEENGEEKTEQSDQDMMEEMNKQMTFMMPIMTVSVALIAPLGLALYWLVSNLVMICERLILNKVFKGEEENNG